MDDWAGWKEKEKEEKKDPKSEKALSAPGFN